MVLNSAIKVKSKEITQLDVGLLFMLERICQKLSSINIHMLPYDEQSLRDYISCDEEKKKRSYINLSQYYNILSSTESTYKGKGLDVNQEKELISIALAKLGLKHSKDSENEVDSNYLIEIYNFEGVQVYRNLEFFRYTTYTLLDVITKEWFNLYYRPQMVTNKLYDYSQKVFKEKKVVYPDVPLHLLKETNSLAQKAYLVDVISISPLFDKITDECTAFLTKIKAREVSALDDVSKLAFI